MLNIEINNIFKSYDKSENFVLKDISFQIKNKDKIGILGPNGAGKTTLISIICGILKSEKGSVSYIENNKNISYDDFKKMLGYVPQELAFYHELTPLQNFNYFGTMYGLTKDEIQKKSLELLKILGLLNVKNKRAKTFSGGMKRRLNLAISILHEPKILFLDEPTVGIDVQSKNAIITFLQELNNKGTTIVYTSHYLKEAEQLCNKVLLIDNGSIVAYNNIEQLKFETKLNSLEEIFLTLTGIAYRD